MKVSGLDSPGIQLSYGHDMGITFSFNSNHIYITADFVIDCTEKMFVLGQNELCVILDFPFFREL